MTVSKPTADLFVPVDPERAHVAFQQLLGSPLHFGARNLMNHLFGRMGDPDGNFIKDFQTDGFHSRMFEIACFAYLEAQGLEIERSSRPDFIVSRGATRVALEATTANPRSGRSTDISIAKVKKLSDQEILQKADEDFPIRMGSVLRSKLEKRYWELPECKDIPFVLIVGPFHEPGSTTYVDESLVRYLYGVEVFDDWTERNGVLVQGVVQIKKHQVDEKSIPSNFFGEDAARHISAVVFANQFTVPRFYRLAKQAGNGPANSVDVRDGYCLVPGTPDVQHYEYTVGGPDHRVESWGQGVTVVHNPRAHHPLPDGFLDCTCEYRLVDGRPERTVHAFHTLTSFMHGSVSPKAAPDVPVQSDFDEARFRARTNIRTTWMKVARRHVLDWVQPAAMLDRVFPELGPALASLEGRVSTRVPALVYRPRDPNSGGPIFAVPFLNQPGRAWAVRLLGGRNLSREAIKTYQDFSETVWFALEQGMLPPADNRKALESALAKWTGRRLFEG